MTTTDFPRSAAAVTRRVKALAGDSQVHVRSSWCINHQRDGYGWHSTILIERGEQRNALVAALEVNGHRVDSPNEYDTFVSAYLPEPEKKQGDGQRGEAFLKSTFGNSTRTEF